MKSKKLHKTANQIILQSSGHKKVTENKTFWKTIIPLFIKRSLKGEKINLIENGKNISKDTELCNIFNGFFSNIIFQLNILKNYQCFWRMIWIKFQFSLFSTDSQITRVLRILNVKSLIRHFLLRLLTLM